MRGNVIVLTGMLFLAACSTDNAGMCGDGVCTPGTGESCTSCAADCGSCAGCGDGTCSPSSGESCASCALDCGACAPSCGNGACDGAETCSTCPGDCGACSGSCSAASCAGCCFGGVCESGSSPSACGRGGNLCMACGSGFTCAGGACVVDPGSRWNLVLDRLTVSTTHHGGSAWDAFGGAADPVVDVRIGSSSASPRRQNGPDDVHMITYSGAPVATDVRASELLAYLSFTVLDEDVTDYERIGSCRVVVPEAAFTGISQTVNCTANPSTDDSGFVLVWHLEPF